MLYNNIREPEINKKKNFFQIWKIDLNDFIRIFQNILQLQVKQEMKKDSITNYLVN